MVVTPHRILGNVSIFGFYEIIMRHSPWRPHYVFQLLRSSVYVGSVPTVNSKAEHHATFKLSG